MVKTTHQRLLDTVSDLLDISVRTQRTNCPTAKHLSHQTESLSCTSTQLTLKYDGKLYVTHNFLHGISNHYTLVQLNPSVQKVPPKISSDLLDIYSFTRLYTCLNVHLLISNNIAPCIVLSKLPLYISKNYVITVDMKTSKTVFQIGSQ